MGCSIAIKILLTLVHHTIKTCSKTNIKQNTIKHSYDRKTSPKSYNINMISVDYNLIAYEYSKNQFTPKPIYPSGERDETKLIDKYSNGKELPILILEDDIVNDDGYGLKKGFYNVRPDKYLDFLLIYQSGKLKAKVPVIKMEVFEPLEPKQEKPKKMSAARYKKEQEKKYRKYLKGENPEEYEYQMTEIQYIQEQSAYLLFYNTNNIELVGLIKF